MILNQVPKLFFGTSIGTFWWRLWMIVNPKVLYFYMWILNLYTCRDNNLHRTGNVYQLFSIMASQFDRRLPVSLTGC